MIGDGKGRQSRKGRSSNRFEPTPHLNLPVEAPTKPAGMSAEASKEWDRFVPLLYACRRVAKADKHALRQYCETWAIWVDLAKKLDKDERFLVEGPKFQRQHLLIRPSIDKALRIIKAMKKVGATPRTRGLTGESRKTLAEINLDGNRGHRTKGEILHRYGYETQLEGLPVSKDKPPAWLSKEAQKVFRERCVAYADSKVYTSLDYSLGVMVSFYYDIHTRIIDQIDGHYIEATNEETGETEYKAHPLYMASNMVFDICHDCEVQFGGLIGNRLKIAPIENGKAAKTLKLFPGVA